MKNEHAKFFTVTYQDNGKTIEKKAIITSYLDIHIMWLKTGKIQNLTIFKCLDKEYIAQAHQERWDKHVKEIEADLNIILPL